MILKSLQLTHFKNHLSKGYDFDDRINCILGKNGSGKTNLLDAIYYLAFTKSALGTSDKLAINHEEVQFTLFGSYDFGTVALQYSQGKPKAMKFDGQELDKLSEAIGKIPLVVVLPDDTAMITEGSEERRKFFDGALSQVDREFLLQLINYNKLLKQRNSLLKNHFSQPVDHKLFETYNEQLIPLSIEISKRRAEVLAEFEPHLKSNYQALHDGQEKPTIRFVSHVDERFGERFIENFPRDQQMQRTLLGSHKDDFEFHLDKKPIRKFGSQGQQKTFVIALKLALYDFLKEKFEDKPLLLLDDIFDKLDDSRIQLLVQLLLDDDRFGQIFITDARSDRSKTLFDAAKHVKFIDLTS